MNTSVIPEKPSVDNTELLTLLNSWDAAPVNAPVYVQCHYCYRFVQKGNHAVTRGGQVRCWRCENDHSEEQERLAARYEANQYGCSGHADEFYDLTDAAEHWQEEGR